MINRINKIFMFTIIFISLNFIVTGCNSSKSNEGMNKVQESKVNNQTQETSPQATNSIDTLQTTPSDISNGKSINSRKITPIDDKNEKGGTYFKTQETSDGYVGPWYTSLPYTGGNSTTIDIKEMSNTSVSFHLYFSRTYTYDGTNIKLENNIARFVDNDGDYKTSGTIEFVNKSIVVSIEKTTMPILKPGKTIFNYKVSKFNAVSITPCSGATDVMLDKGIEIDFGRKIFNTTNSVGAILTKPNVPMGPNDGSIILDGEIKGNKLILTPSSEFLKTMNLKIEAGQKYELGIDEGVLRDEKGNINNDINLEFTTKK